jgi:hypothetical protein
MAGPFLEPGVEPVRTTTLRGVLACARAGFAAVAAVRFRVAARRAALVARAGVRLAGFVFFVLLALLAAVRRFGAVRFRLTAFFAVRAGPVAFLAAPVFFAPERRCGARAAFRLAIDRPFAGIASYLDCFR